MLHANSDGSQARHYLLFAPSGKARLRGACCLICATYLYTTTRLVQSTCVCRRLRELDRPVCERVGTWGCLDRTRRMPQSSISDWHLSRPVRRSHPSASCTSSRVTATVCTISASSTCPTNGTSEYVHPGKSSVRHASSYLHLIRSLHRCFLSVGLLGAKHQPSQQSGH